MLKRLCFAAMVALGTAACTPRDLCENKVLKIEPNPSRTRFAIVFNRECGATVGDNVQVSVLLSDKLPDDGGNTLIADSMPEGALVPAVEWQSDTALGLTLDERARIFTKETLVNGVTVTYFRPEAASAVDLAPR